MNRTVNVSRQGWSRAVAWAGVVLIGLCCSTSFGQNNLRIFLSSSSPGALPAIPNPGPGDRPNLPTPPEFAAQSNPIVASTSVVTRKFYIWAQAMDGASTVLWNGIGLNIDADGPVTLSNLAIYNPNWFTGGNVNRWQGANVPPVSAGGTEYNGINLVVVTTGYGVRRGPRPDGYADSTADGGRVLLGSFDATYTPPAAGAVYLEVGSAGIVRQGGSAANDRVFLGFGEATGLAGNAFGTRSGVAEATFSTTAGPANDLCVNATLVVDGETPYTTVGAGTDGPAEAFRCNVFGNTGIFSDVWFRYVAPRTGMVLVDVCGATFDNKAAVYAGVCPSTADTAVACNDDACGSSAYVAFLATSGQTYRIRVGGFSAGSTGTGRLRISQAPGPCPGDFDRSGTLQPADVAAFVARWFSDLQTGCVP